MNKLDIPAFRELQDDLHRQEAEILRLRTRINLISTGSQIIGTQPTVPSSVPIVVWLNASGAARVRGEVVVYTLSTDRSFNVTSTEGDAAVLGVVDEAIAVGANGRIKHIGYHSNVAVIGAVIAGSFLKTSSTPGKAMDAGLTPVSGAFARALTSAAGPGESTVGAYIFPALRGSNHAEQHYENAADELIVENLGSLEFDTSKRLGPDGFGGLSWLSGGASPGYTIIPFGSEAIDGHGFTNSGGADAYTQFGVVRRKISPIVFGYTPLRILIEVTLETLTAGKNVKARLWDATDSAAIADSTVETTSETPVRLRSSFLTLDTDEHEYYIEFGGEAAGSYVCYDAVIYVGDLSLSEPIYAGGRWFSNWFARYMGAGVS